MVVYWGRCGHGLNRKRVQRFRRCMSLAGMSPGPNTSAVHPQHKVYPYLLRGVPVVWANLVWSKDINYLSHSGCDYSNQVWEHLLCFSYIT
jgi:putative transposase